MEWKKSIYSYKFWISILGVCSIMYLNLTDEIRLLEGTDICSVLYLWMNRHLLGGISILLLFICALPSALQFNVERNSGAMKDHIIYEGKRDYLCAKIIVTWAVTFLACLLGYVLLLIVLSLQFPLFPEDTEFINQLLIDFPYAAALGESPFLFILVVLPEVGLYAFMSVVALFVSLYSSNTYVILVSPVIFFYLWNYLSGTLQLPEWLCWTLKRDFGFAFLNSVPTYMLFNLCYFLLGSMIIGGLFYRRGLEEVENV